MFDFLKSKESVALNVEPYLNFTEIGKEVRIVVDSGPEDMNQTSTQLRLDEQQSMAITNLHIKGFDKIYKGWETSTAPASDKVEIAKDTTPLVATTVTESDIKAVEEKATELKSESVVESKPEPELIKPLASTIASDKYEDARLARSLVESQLQHGSTEPDERSIRKLEELIEDAFKHEEGIVMGEILLEVANGRMLSIAKPVYVIIPSEFEGQLEYVDALTARDYIEDQWKDEFSSALVAMTSPSEASVQTPARRREKESNLFNGSRKSLLTLLAAALALLFVGYSAAAMTKHFKGNQGAAVSMDSALGGLGAAPASNKSSNKGGLFQVPQNPTPEEYATLHNYAKEDILRRMNIDLDEQADLGCLTE